MSHDHYDLLPTDTIRVLRKFRHTPHYVDGARIADLPRGGVVSLLKQGRIEVRRDGKIVRPRGWTPPQKRNGGKCDPWRRYSEKLPPPNPKPKITARPCMCCGNNVGSTGPGHRLCDTCRYLGSPFRG